MSREIKFRAWDKQWGEMLLPEEWSMPRIQLDGSLYDSFGDPMCARDYIIEQYTGLKDKNGKEIYEGDIVRLYGPFVSAITWRDDCCGFMWYDNSGDGYCELSKVNEEYYEVVGNIHENSELLEN